VIAIVGGGITGLALSHFLSARGTPHVVLEASGRPGGVIRSGRVEGRILEWGPQRTRLTASIQSLIDELELADQVITAPPALPLFVYARGRLRRVPFSALDFVRSDIASLPGRLAIARDFFTRGAQDQESVADFFTRKIGRELYENLVGPLYGGLYASDPAEMRVGLSLRHVLREFGIGRSLLAPLLKRGGAIQPPPACSFREGMETLPNALFARNRQNVRLKTPVERISRGQSGWDVHLAGETIAASRVVITSPAAATATILADAAPEVAGRIESLVYNPLGVVHLHSETDLVGLGYQVSFAEALVTRGVTFNDSLFGRAGVYTVYLGGGKARQVAEWDDELLAETAVREFHDVSGFDARPLAVEREWMPAWDRSWAAIQGMRLPDGIHIAANWESRPGIPGRLAQTARLAEELSAR
jgi:protoporphyrinogen/coproporphyrinogen III oxidase